MSASLAEMFFICCCSNCKPFKVVGLAASFFDLTEKHTVRMQQTEHSLTVKKENQQTDPACISNVTSICRFSMISSVKYITGV